MTTEAELPVYMRATTQTELEGRTNNDTNGSKKVDVDALLKQFMPGYEEFKFFRNQFNTEIKKVTDAVKVVLPNLTIIEAAKMFNAPVNFVALSIIKTNLGKLNTWLADENNKNKCIPKELKLFYYSDNDYFFGKLTVGSVLKNYTQFCLPYVSKDAFEEIETEMLPVLEDPAQETERQGKIKEKKEAWSKAMKQTIHDYKKRLSSPGQTPLP